ncbi:NUDIX family hydrolase [Nitzschia inconspicua]|uniref:NUDIX family hydrolase n=1 Tax=Nitzschia inconspicua TaxID=303405 RepID=A0A9K3LR60_9STRA|nr:NUDIX family hydrolase [Nitzschia inconspicua]
MKNHASMIPSPKYPRAAVAATIQLASRNGADNQYLLVQRSNPPDEGLWSIPGGKIELGESTLQAVQREIYEETKLITATNFPLSTCSPLRWHPHPFMTTDAIFKTGEDSEDEFTFHYVIAHCFAKIVLDGTPDEIPRLQPSDDALDAKWCTMTEILERRNSKNLSEGVIAVLERAEELSQIGALHVS